MDHNTIIKNMNYNVFVAKIDVTQKAFNDNLATGDFGVFGSSFKNHDIFDTQMLFYSAACQNPTFPAGPDENGNWVKNGTPRASTLLPFCLMKKRFRDLNLTLTSN